MLVAAANHYELLQITPAATSTELRQAFRRLSKHFHPDTTELPEREAEEGFQRLQQAYLTLSDPERRSAYDATLRAIQPVLRSAPRAAAPAARPLPVRRALSGGEWFALLLLALAVIFSLVLGVGLAWARGAELLRPPSWWVVDPQLAELQVVEPQRAEQTADSSSATAPDDVPAAPTGAALQPSAAGSGALAG